MNSLQTTQINRPIFLPAPMQPEVERALTAGLAALDDGSLNRDVVPAGALKTLRDRLGILHQALAPASRQAVAKVLATLDGMAGRGPRSEVEAAALVRQDVEDLSDVSLSALEAAARAFRRGEIGDGRWRPTAGELRKEARRREAGARAELWKISRLLNAPSLIAPKPVYVSRERAAALFGQLVSVGSVER